MSVRLAAAILAALLSLQPAHAAPPVILPGTLSICSAINRPPMEFFNAAQHPEGVDIALGAALAAQLQLKPRFLNIDFASLVPALLAGDCDIVLAQLFIKPERLKVIDEIPYMNAQTGILVLAGTPPVTEPQELAGKTVVAVAGTTSADNLAKTNLLLARTAQKPIHIVLVPGNIPALQQLLYHQADAYAVAYETGAYYAQLRPGIFALGGKPYFKIEAGIGVAKNKAALRDALQAALARLRANGAYAAIFAQWHLTADMLP
jgi:polar amino acid transport system substrate-binding protein